MKNIKIFSHKTILLSVALTIMSIVQPRSSNAAITFTISTVTNLLPNGGVFTSSTVGWNIDNSGGGTFNWNSGSGLVGLNCNAGKSIKLQTWHPDSTHASIINLDGQVRDQIKIRAHIRANPSIGNSTVAGLFWMTAQGALSLDTYNFTTISQDTVTINAVDFSTDSNAAVWGRMTTWTWLTMVFTPPHSDWWQLRNLQFLYSANTNAPFQTEMQINQIQMYLYQYQGTP